MKKHKSVFALLQLLRPQQWIKNTFVWVGYLFSQGWHQPGLFTKTLIASLVFCFTSSAIYIFNDIIDRHRDRLHPFKMNRPIAANHISLPIAWAITIFIACGSLGIGFYISKQIGILLLLYILLNIAYSLYLKHVMILDVILIASGFMIRILVGTVGIGIPPSWWLLICGTMLAIFLGFTKRRAEVSLFSDMQFSTRTVLQHYSQGPLNNIIHFMAIVVIITYGAYALHQDAQFHPGPLKLIYTLPLVLLAIMRYLYLLNSENYPSAGIDIARDLLRDYPLLVTVSAWLLLTIAVLSMS